MRELETEVKRAGSAAAKPAAPCPVPIAAAGLSLGVVIPALNEEDLVGRAVESCWKAGAREVIVADGGSTDGTPKAAAAAGAIVLPAPRGRPAQMNAGACLSTADVLIFLHADACLPRAAGDEIRAVLADPEVGGGAFRLRVDAPSFYFRALSTIARARAYWWRTVFGDQGIFARRELFEKIGGYRDLPILEDFDFVKRLRRKARFRLLRGEVRSSVRRWRKKGKFRTSLINWSILFLYQTGADPVRLAKWYR